MNKKQLIVAAMAAVLSVSSANAVSNIDGITNGGSGSFNIDPSQINGDVGYRYYDYFNLGQGDIANLIYQGLKSGQIRDIETFINLVGDKINIQGIVNAMRDGAFHDGHAVFISPKGMVVGASGVLNVGTLSVVTPTDNKFNELKNGYNSGDFTVINNISTLRNGAGNNYGGNAAVDIKGTVIARNGVDIRGSQVDVSGGIVNGYKGADMFNSAATAQALFNNLVNTDGIITASANQIANNNGRIVIKTGDNTSGSLNVTGRVANLNKTEMALTNHAGAGMTISGALASNGKLNVYNNDNASALTVSGNLTNKNAALSVSNKGTDLNITNTAKLTTNNALEIVNNGTGKLTMAGTTTSDGKTDIVNRATGGMNVTGVVTAPTVRIVNEGGKLVFSGNANADESVSFRNSGTGMEISGLTKAGEGILVHNEAGNATLNGELNVTAGNVAVFNEGTGKLTTGTNSKITNQGNVAIKNTSTGGMELNGTITNEGEVAINNTAGTAVVGGTINNVGNMGIINKGNGTGLTVNANITNEGKLKLVNSTGTNGLTVNGSVNNAAGNLYVYNDAGHANINGTLANTEAGNLYVLSRNNSTGITTGTNSVISNEIGNLAIKHNGTGALNGTGMDLNGTVTNTAGETAINNYKGDMHVAGKITADGKNLGIINRAAGGSMLVEATVNADNETTNIKNYGNGDMTVNGEITHNGRLNVLANEGKLILGGKINNNGTDMTYAAARANGDGIDVKDTFNATATKGATILIKNITGSQGLNYAGTMSSTNGQAEVYNKVGDMTVTGTINATPAVVLNSGDKLTVTNAANLQGDVKVVNRGSEKADVADKYKDNFHE